MGQKLKYIQSVFNKGELSPRLVGRVDNQSYYKSYKDGSNFLPFPEGSGTFRPGSVFVNEVKDSTKLTIIRPFRFSTVQNYALEFGDQYVRFYRNRGQVESGGSPYEVSTPYLEADLRELYFFQSADVLYILHPDYQTRKLTRTSDTNWTLSAIDFVDGPYYPINASDTTIEIHSSGTATASTSIFTSDDVGRQIRILNGSGWLNGTITAYTSGTVVDTDITTHTVSATTSWRLGVFGGSLGWPAVGSIFEERLILARTANLPSTIWGSRTGELETFSPSDPDDGVVRDDDGFSFTIANDEVNSINWISSGRQMLIGSTGAEHSVSGGTSSSYAPITPSNVTIKRESNYGSKPNIAARRIGNAVLYPSQSAKKVRELYYEFGIDSYVSRDTTIFNEHLLRDGIVDTTYVQEPDPYYWACLDSGKLVGMVYDRMQEIEGWHSHSLGGTDAAVESVASIPRPGDENDDLWMIVSRTVDGSTVRYVEYMSEIYEDVEAPISSAPDRFYAKFLDSCITYDGYLDALLTLDATTGSGITVTAGSSVFASGDVGKELRAGDGVAEIVSYVSATEITVDIDTDFDASSYAAGLWCLATDSFSGLDHLEGEIVSVQSDGYTTDAQTVSSGSITIPQKACVVHVGLPYSMFIEMNAPEFPNLGTIQGRQISISRIHVYLTDSYSFSVNDEYVDIEENVKFLTFPLQTNQAPALKSGVVSLHPPSGYQRDSNIKITHSVAMPFTLNYVVLDLDVNN